MFGFALVLALVAGQSDDQDWPPKPAATPASKKADGVGPAAAPNNGQTILVLDLTVGPDVRPELPKALSEQLTVQVRQYNREARVLGMEDVRAMMALQAQRARLNCQDVSCLAEVGGALGAKEVVNGSLARIGDNYVLTIKRVNAKQVRVIADSTRQIPLNQEGELIESLKRQVKQLFPPKVANTDDLFSEDEAPAPAKSHTAAYLLLAGAAVGVAAVIAGAVMYENFQSDKNRATTNAVPVSTIASDHSEAVAGTAILFAGVAVATAGALGAVLTW